MNGPSAPTRGSILRHDGRSWGVTDFIVRCTKRLIFNAVFTATRTWQWPDRSDTVAGLQAQTFTGAQTVSDTTDATTPTAAAAVVISGGMAIAKKIFAGGKIESQITDTGTANQPDCLVLNHRSSNTPAAAFGTVLRFLAESTTTEDRNQGLFQAEWVVATDASRTARMTWYVYDTAAREVIRAQASGSAPMVGFLGAAAVARPSSTGETAGFTAGAGTAVNDASTFTGNVGATAYRISDIVKHLKNLGLIAS